MNMNSRMAMAEKLSVQQLQQAIQSGSLPAYIGIPLIEQKTKEKSQMAAAQQGQQKPLSVASQILQQAEQQEQQDQGIDQLPSNLPMMEEGENGYAGGGIIAFAERGRVNDPYAEDFAPSGTDYSYTDLINPDIVGKDNYFEALRKSTAEEAGMGINLENDPSSYTSEYISSLANRNQRAEVPSYLRNVSDRVRKEEAAAQAEAVAREGREKRIERERVGLPMADRLNVPGINPFTPQERVNQGVRDEVPNPPDAFRNEPTYEPVAASPAGRYIEGLTTDLKSTLGTYDLREKLYRQYSSAASGMSDATDVERTAAQEMLKRIKDMSGPELRALAEQGRPPAMTAVETTSPTSRVQPPAAPEAPATSSFSMDDTAGTTYTPRPQGGQTTPNAGIVNAPGARSVNPNVPGAPRTAPQGGGGRGTLPSTLDAAEKSDSPAASRAVSMLDKYVAQLEKGGNDIDRDKKEALYMALIQGGLGMMGGTSPNAFANIAAGLLPATQAYQQAIAGIKKGERERLEKLINTGLKKEEFLLKAEEIGVKRETARMVYDAAMARTGAMGGGGARDKLSFLEQKQLEGMELKYRQEAAKATGIMNKELGSNIAYTSLITKINNPKTPEAERRKLQASADAMKQPYLSAINDAKEMASLYGGKLNRPSESPAGNMPKGIPQGSVQIGTSGGKPVYKAPDGKQYIVE
jgi:hypothetical protein